jgi:cell wall-associated NlpC family hydrolase
MPALLNPWPTQKKVLRHVTLGSSTSQKNNQIVPIGQAKRGDLVFFQFDEDAAADHVGIVKFHHTTLKYLQVYEGNTSSGKTGSQSNGDGFYLKKRNYQTIMAVARPKE